MSTVEETAQSAEDKTYQQDLLEGQDLEPETAETEQVVEETTTEPVAEETTAPVEEATETPDFLQQVTAAGFEGVETAEDAQARVLAGFQERDAQVAELQRQIAEQQQYVQYGHQYLDHLRTQEQQQQQQQAEPEYQSRWAKAPKFDLNSIHQYQEAERNTAGEVVLDPATGQPNMVWKKETPAEVVQGYGDAMQFQRDFAEAWLSNPLAVLQELASEFVPQMINQGVQQATQNFAHESFISQIKAENEWMYQKDPLTNRPTNAMSPEGDQMLSILDRLEQAGVTDSRQQWELAEELMEKWRQDNNIAQQTATEQATTTAADKRREHQQKSVQRTAQNAEAVEGGNRGNSTQKNTPRNRNLSRGQDLVQDLKSDGVV